MQRDFRVDHNTTLLGNLRTQTLCQVGVQKRTNCDTRLTVESRDRQSNLPVTVLKLKQDLLILIFVGFAVPLTHLCHYLQSHSDRAKY